MAGGKGGFTPAPWAWVDEYDRWRNEYELASMGRSQANMNSMWQRITGSTPISDLPEILNKMSKNRQEDRCDYCNGLHDEDTAKCQNCGAPR